MWLGFLAAIVACALLLYVPGFLFFRGLRFSPVLSLCAAPLASLLCYATLPIAYYAIGIPCNLPTVALPTLAIGLSAYLLARKREQTSAHALSLSAQPPVRIGTRTLDFDACMIAVCLAIGLIVCLYLFVFNLPRLDSFFSRFDNQTHLNLVQAFLDSGKWSTLHTSNYLSSAINATPRLTNTGGFYPAAWHDLVALVCLASATPVTVASNAVITFTCAFTSPLCLYLLMRVLAKEDRGAMVAGALLAAGSCALPWTFVLKGPTWPDMLANMLVAAFVAVVVLFVSTGLARKMPAAFACFGVLSLAALALAHPSALFTAYVFLAAYGAHVIWHATAPTSAKPWPTPRRVAALLCYVLVIAGAWVLFHFTPPLKSILSYHWKENRGLGETIKTLVSFGFGIGRRQLVFTLGAIAGIVCCVRTRRFWLLFAPAFFALCYVACANNWEIVKYWLAAFWYMTPYRFGTRLVLFALPVAAIGLGWLCSTVYALLGAKQREGSRLNRYAVAAIAAVLFVANYAPISFYRPQTDSGYESSFARVHRKIHEIYDDGVEQVYSLEEIEFVNKAKDVIEKGALVINFPHDGSMWAYGVNDINTYYRDSNPNSVGDDAKLIAARLNEFATNQEVHDAVQRTGAQYVLKLDQKVPYDQGVWIPQYYQSHIPAWAGIDAVDDNTPGFTTVLAEGDQMRLYRIDY